MNAVYLKEKEQDIATKDKTFDNSCSEMCFIQMETRLSCLISIKRFSFECL